MNRKERRAREKQHKKNPKQLTGDHGAGDVNQAFAAAAKHLQAGHIQEAEGQFNAILQDAPGHGGALHLLGVAAHMAGDNDKAVDLIGRAIATGGGDFSFHVNLGNALKALGRFEEAEASYLTALQTAPGYAEIHNNLGVVLNDLGKPREAVNSCRRALEINQDYPEAHYNLGNAFMALGEAEEAGRCFQKAVMLKADYHDAFFNLGHLLRQMGRLDPSVDCFRSCLEIDSENVVDHNNLGISLHERGDLEEASACYRRAIALDPNHVEAHNNLSKALSDTGDLIESVKMARRTISLMPDLAEAHNTLAVVLREMEEPEEALICLARAMELKPNYVEAINNRGAALNDLGENEEAIACYKQALDLDLNFAAAHLNLGNVLRKQGHFDEALVRYRKALQINPKFAGLHEGLSCALLSDGNLEEGWREFEWRSTLRSFGSFTDMVWNGEDLAGKTILIWPEQGIGDQIMFANCLPDIVEMSTNCIIEIDRRLVSLFARSFPTTMVHGGYKFTGSYQVMREGFEWLTDYPPVDFFCPIGSLPRFLRSSIESFPDDNAFLKADPDRAAYWREKVEGLGPGRKVGIAWRSLLMNKIREIRYPPLESWAPVFALSNTVFINAQAGYSTDELDEIEDCFGVRPHTFEELDLKDNLDDTAALLSALDAVVSADTYLPMMAGGLGVPAWRITRSKRKEDWSTLGAEKYKWFSSLTVNFGETHEELLKVFQRVAYEVAKIP